MSTPQRISYGFIALMLILVGWLHVATPMITALFSYFALTKLRFSENKFGAICLFLLIVGGMFYIFFFFMGQAYTALPHIASTAIPAVLDVAKDHGLELPFANVGELKKLAMDNVKDELGRLGGYARLVLFQFATLIIGIVVAVSIFFNAKFDEETHAVRNNLYSLTARQIVDRFITFYESFATVMGAQMVISLINTSLTGIFLVFVGLPYSTLIIVLTFLCGLLPIIGNILSNTLIVGVALTVSPNLAVASLIFLVVLHKLEYFLNSKIVGDRIKNPMWLTLLGLILGERLMGIPGMILAPVVLHYIKVEMSRNRVAETPPAAS